MLDEFLLRLFVVFSGLAAGAGLYEMRINVPRWFRHDGDLGVRVDAEAMRTDDSGRRFWAFVTTGPLTLLTLASCVVAWHPQTARERWWLAAAGIVLVERIGTLAYFIPRAVKLFHPERLPSGRAEAIALQWVRANRLRVALSLVGALAGLYALAPLG